MIYLLIIMNKKDELFIRTLNILQSDRKQDEIKRRNQKELFEEIKRVLKNVFRGDAYENK